MFSKMTFLTPPSHTGVQIEFFVLKNQKKRPPSIVNTFFKKNVEKSKNRCPRCNRNFHDKKFHKKMWKKNFFNKSVNLSTKFSKKSIFDEKWQKIPPDQQWVGVKKVVFSTTFFVLSVIWYQKTVFFWWFWKCSKFSVPVAIGTLDFVLSEKKCQDSPHVMSKIHEFLEYDFKIFSRFSKKVEKKGFFWLLPHIEKLKKITKKWLFFEKLLKSLSN